MGRAFAGGRKLREYKAFRQSDLPAMSESAAAAPVDAPFRTFMCDVCGFHNNEAEGWPSDGIAAGTRWEDVPETWTCPDCGVTKSDFEMVEV
jgi:rubredoxin